MIYANRVAIVLLAGVAALHVYGTAFFLWHLARGGRLEWLFFGVTDCCDIPFPEVQNSVLTTAIKLAVVAYASRWIISGLLRLKEWAWWAALVLNLLIIMVHTKMMTGMVDEITAQHRQLIFWCWTIIALLLASAPLHFRRFQKDAVTKNES